MDNLDTMWIRLAEHQPFADAGGCGKAWKIMCEQRTEEAARAACASAQLAWAEAEAAVAVAVAIYFINKAGGK